MFKLKAKKIALVRLDRIGDLVVTLPVDEATELKEFNCHWIINEDLKYILEHREPQRPFKTLNLKLGFKNIPLLFRFLRIEKFDAFVIFHAPWWVSLTAWLARVPLRIGPKSQWHSYLFLNQAIRQKRSQSLKHEFEYNQDLLAQGLNLNSKAQDSHFLKLKSKDTTILNKWNLISKNYILIHPGMRGSAKNWPEANYHQLIKNLVHNHIIVITGTESDMSYLQELKKNWSQHSNVRWLISQLSNEQLLTILAHARVTVAPSTGVPHLSASLGTATIGIYPPVRVQSPVRWGLRGAQAKSISPQVDCPGHFHCLKEKCPHYDCMPLISVDMIKNEVEKFL